MECKNRGNTYLASGELAAAAGCYREAIALDPRYAEAYNNLGVTLMQLGNGDEAMDLFDQALSLKPDLAQAHLNRGNVLSGRGLDEEAIVAFRKALSLDPALSEAHNNLGGLLQAAGRPYEALACFRTAIALKPDFADAYCNLGDLLHERGEADEALLNFQKAIQIRPDFAEACNNVGILSKEKGLLKQSRVYFEQALALKPDFPQARNNLGMMLYEMDRMEEALAHLQYAFRIAPQNWDVCNNLGILLQDRGQLEDALACYEKAISLSPDEDWRRFNLSMPLLSLGHLTEGWNCYQHRFAAGTPKRAFENREWAGEDLTGKTLLVWGEQGVGDEILFAGLLPDVMASTGRCIFECAPKLVPLFRRSFPGAHVVPRTTPADPATQDGIDFQCSAGGLAKWLRPAVHDFPWHSGYLEPEPERVHYWISRLAALGPGPKVGISWRGHVATGARALQYTSIAQWAPVFAVQGVHFINLQYDRCGDELALAQERFGVRVHAFEEVDLFNDLAEAAALTRALDLVISAPTATSFLAAAVGVPTWMMSFGRPWQMLGTEHTPWFPAMRGFFRHWEQGWDEVLSSVARGLDDFVAGIEPHSSQT